MKMGTPTTVPRRHRGESPRRQAERAIAQLHHAELLAIKAEIEAGGDVREITRARRAARGHPGAGQPAAHVLAWLRCRVEDRLAVLAAESGQLPGPLLTPREVDLGTIDLWPYYWAAILLGVALAQNAVDGQAATSARATPDAFTLFDAQFPEFCGTRDDDPATAGWPAALSYSQLIPGTGAA
jgi:hypothetical protein